MYPAKNNENSKSCKRFAVVSVFGAFFWYFWHDQNNLRRNEHL